MHFRLHKLEDEFYTLIKISEIAKQLILTEEIVDLIYVFWKLKRKVCMILNRVEIVIRITQLCTKLYIIIHYEVGSRIFEFYS